MQRLPAGFVLAGGIFFCPDYRTEGTVQKTVAELRALGLENESYWKSDAELANA